MSKSVDDLDILLYNSDIMIEYKMFDVAGIDFPFYIGKGGHHTSFNPHTHNFTELEIILSGSADHIVEGRAYQIKRGDVIVLAPSYVHELQNVQELMHFNFKFDLQKLLLLDTDLQKLAGFQALFVPQPLQRYQHVYSSYMRLDEPRFSEVLMLCELMYNEWNEKSSGYKWIIKSYFLALLACLARGYSSIEAGAPWKLKNITDTAAFVQQHIKDKHSVASLAAMACLSERQYARRFKQLYGMPPLEYIIDCRLTLACSMMRDTQKSLMEISLNCGFSDAVYFNRQFKNRFGITPGQYRKQLDNP